MTMHELVRSRYLVLGFSVAVLVGMGCQTTKDPAAGDTNTSRAGSSLAPRNDAGSGSGSAGHQAGASGSKSSSAGDSGTADNGDDSGQAGASGHAGKAGTAANGGAGGAGGAGGSAVAGSGSNNTAGTAAMAGSGATGSGATGGSVSQPIAGGPAPITPDPDSTYLSNTDRDLNGVNLSPDQLSGEWLGLGTWGVRSTRSIAAHQGVFYFEVYTANLDYFDIGVATAAAPLGMAPGATSDGFGLDVGGNFFEGAGDAVSFMPAGNTYGFVVDYRGSHPILHIIGGDPNPASLLLSQNVDAISAPLFILLSGNRRVAGYQATINAGNDTVNQPFKFDPVAVLNNGGLSEVASALVLGWGATHTKVLDTPPTLTVAAPSATSIALGGSVTLSASASDVEDGSLTANINWDVLSEGNGPERVHGSGGAFVFTPNAIGQHPIQVSVSDATGKLAQKTITITVPGAVQQFTDVRLTLEPGLSGSGISLSPDALSAHWTVNAKNGVRANQGLYGGFWYVEGHRLAAEANQAIGLVIGNVSLDPYHFDIAPPSCSVNTVGPGVYKDLIVEEQYATPNVQYYGFAVDYRGTSPIVYVIMNGGLANTLNLTDVTVPIYPMLYGNVTNLGTPYDMQINFGATAFHENPKAALTAAGISPTGLQLCWGAMNQSCLQH